MTGTGRGIQIGIALLIGTLIPTGIGTIIPIGITTRADHSLWGMVIMTMPFPTCIQITANAY
jgi:hypothetical protein